MFSGRPCGEVACFVSWPVHVNVFALKKGSPWGFICDPQWYTMEVLIRDTVVAFQKLIPGAEDNVQCGKDLTPREGRPGPGSGLTNH